MTKQTELRRLMKLQREKKEQEAAAHHQAAPKGILKRKAPPSATVATAPLLSTRTRYSSSNDDHDNEEKDESKKRQENSKKRARGTDNHVKSIQRPAAAAAAAPVEPKEEIPSKQVANQQQQQDAAWREFEDLIDKVEDEAVANDGTAATPTATASTKANEGGMTDDDVVEDSTEPSSSVTAEVEQMAYEVRIAKLRLRAEARRKRKKASTTANNVPAYTPQLAEQDGDDNELLRISPLEQLKRKRAKMMRDAS